MGRQVPASAAATPRRTGHLRRAGVLLGALVLAVSLSGCSEKTRHEWSNLAMPDPATAQGEHIFMLWRWAWVAALVPAAAVLYAANMLAITLTGALRTRELLHQPRVHVAAIDPSVFRTLKFRAYLLPAFAATAFVLGFFLPGWNMLAMVPAVFIRAASRAG